LTSVITRKYKSK